MWVFSNDWSLQIFTLLSYIVTSQNLQKSPLLLVLLGKKPPQNGISKTLEVLSIFKRKNLNSQDNIHSQPYCSNRDSSNSDLTQHETGEMTQVKRHNTKPVSKIFVTGGRFQRLVFITPSALTLYWSMSQAHHSPGDEILIHRIRRSRKTKYKRRFMREFGAFAAFNTSPQRS